MSHATVSRRTILRAGAMGAAALAVPLRLLDAIAPTTFSANTWTHAQWAGLVGSTFRVAGGGAGTPVLTLTEATDMLPASAPRTASRQWFALRFAGAPSATLCNNAQTLHHAKLGQVDLLLVPGAVGDGTQSYTAIVNRI